MNRMGAFCKSRTVWALSFGLWLCNCGLQGSQTPTTSVSGSVNTAVANATASAATPDSISYQGRLSDSDPRLQSVFPRENEGFRSPRPHLPPVPQ